jgi:hypothetical protein
MSAPQEDFDKWPFDCCSTMILITVRLLPPFFWGGGQCLKSYQCRHQHFPLVIAQGMKLNSWRCSVVVTECIKPKLCKWHRSDWISDKTWAFVGQRTALQQVGKLSHGEGRWTKQLIWASLCNDSMACTLGVDHLIKAKLAYGDMQEAFPLLTGWYRAALETALCPYFR